MNDQEGEEAYKQCHRNDEENSLYDIARQVRSPFLPSCLTSRCLRQFAKIFVLCASSVAAAGGNGACTQYKDVLPTVSCYPASEPFSTKLMHTIQGCFAGVQ